MFPNSFSTYLKDILSKDPIIKYRDDKNLQNLIDVIQTEFKCCGISDKGYKDWSRNDYFNCTATNKSAERCAVPYSCCRNPKNIDVSMRFDLPFQIDFSDSFANLAINLALSLSLSLSLLPILAENRAA